MEMEQENKNPTFEDVGQGEIETAPVRKIRRSKTADMDITKSGMAEMKVSKFAGLDDPNYLAGKDPNRAYRLIDFERFRKSGYNDHRGWMPLTKSNLTTEKLVDPAIEYGAKSDGFFHSGSCIWAWRTRELNDFKREKLRKKTSSLLREGLPIKKDRNGNVIGTRADMRAYSDMTSKRGRIIEEV